MLLNEKGKTYVDGTNTDFEVVEVFQDREEPVELEVKSDSQGHNTSATTGNQYNTIFIMAEGRQFPVTEAGLFAFVTYRALIKTVDDAAPTTNF